MHLVTDRQGDKLHQAVRVHERPEQEAVLPTLFLDPGGEDGAAELADRGDEDEPEADEPHFGRINQSDLRAQAC